MMEGRKRDGRYVVLTGCAWVSELIRQFARLVHGSGRLRGYTSHVMGKYRAEANLVQTME